MNEGGKREDDFTKFTRVSVSVVVLGQRHQLFRTYSKEGIKASREDERAQRDLGVGVTLQFVPNSTRMG